MNKYRKLYAALLIVISLPIYAQATTSNVLEFMRMGGNLDACGETAASAKLRGIVDDILPTVGITWASPELDAAYKKGTGEVKSGEETCESVIHYAKKAGLAPWL